MRKLLLSTLFILLGYYLSFGQISFFDATDSLRYGTLRSGAPMAIADMNADGLDDIVCLDSKRFLYIEYQQADTSVFDGVFYGDIGSDQWSICISDVDSNGYNDIFTGGSYNGLHLLRANADGSNYDFDVITDPSIFLQGSNFVDINTDGYADIFAAHDEGLSVPFRNDSDGNFTPDYSLILAESSVPSDNSGNYGTVWTDYDNDGDLDLYISKCRLGIDDPTDPRRLNLLMQNDGQNNFVDVAAQANLLPFGQSWASDFGDIDNDGDLDCFIINHDIANSLYRNNGNGTFTDISNTIIVPFLSTGQGMQVKFVDFDNDTYVDLLYTALGTIHAVLHNNGDGTFTNISNAFPIDERIHSATVGDLNNDGFIDVYAGYGFGYNQISNQHDRLFYNSGNDNHYLKVLLKGTASNTNAIGARLELYGAWGKQIREVRSGESYGIMTSFASHFGLGDTENIDSLFIYWPSGNVDRVTAPPADTLLMITEGDFCLPFADFEYTSPGLNVQLTASGDVGVDSWEWTIDGNVQLSGEEINYVFPSPGAYNVCLNTDGSCGASQYCELVFVECVTLESFFTFQVDGLDLSFEDLSFGGPNTWLWEFGDGNTSSEQDPLHGFDMPGNYFVCLTISNECGNAGFCQFINVACDQVTTAFDKDVNELEVAFTDFSSAGTTDWNWDFGDGNSSTAQNPVHQFATPGTYQVCLSIDGVCGDGMYCEDISVSCSIPEASFLVFDDELTIDFQDDTENVPTSWNWDFGDGNTSTQQNPVHTYDTTGFFTACLIVSNVCGIDTFCRALVVTCDAPLAGFSTTANGLSYSFVDTTQNEPEELSWLINDTLIANDVNSLNYFFPEPGTYEVCLQASNICGADTLCQTIDVSCAIPSADFVTTSDELNYLFTDSTLGGADQWAWYVEDVLSGTQQTLDFTFDNPGDYEVCLIAGNICGLDTLCQTINVSCDIPVADFTAATDELDYVFTDATVGTTDQWTWYVEDILSGTESSLDYTFDNPGDYEVCLTTGNICGIDTICQIINVSCIPPESGFEYTINGLSANFVDTSANNPTEWLWLVDDIPAGQDNTLDYFFPVQGNYEVCLIAGSICGSDTTCVSVDLNCLPPIVDFDINPNGLNVTFNDLTANDPETWLWTVNSDEVSTEQSFDYTFPTDGTYEVCLEAGNSCDIAQFCQSVSVSCNAISAGFSISSTDLTISLTDESSANATFWNWDFGGGNTSTGQNPTYTYAAPGNYTICLIAANNCDEADQLCQDVSVSCTPPEADFNSNSNLLFATFTDISTGNPLAWNWTFGDGGTSTQQNPQHIYSDAGTYTVCLRSSSICGFTEHCEEVVISCPVPEAGFVFEIDELSVVLTDTSLNMPAFWNWNFGDGTLSIDQNTSHIYDAPGQYIICLSTSSSCGTDQACRQITVGCTAPEADFTVQTNELAVNLTDNSINTPTAWLWDFGDGNTADVANPDHTYDMPGTYEVCLIAGSICGSSTVCQQLTVSCQAPVADFGIQSNELAYSFTDNTSNAPTSWLWTFGDGNMSEDQNVNHEYGQPGTYEVCLQSSSICGTDISCQVIEVSCTPPQTNFSFNSNELIVNFLDNSTEAPEDWSWTFGDGNSSNDPSPTHIYASPGAYTVCLTASSICGSTESCQVINLNCQAPLATFASNPNQLEVSFLDISENNPTEWSWNFGDGGVSNEQNPVHQFAEPGTYTVCLTASSICGSAQFCTQLEVNCMAPQANFTSSAQELTLSFTDISENNPAEWMWSFGDGSTSVEQNPSHTYPFPGSYLVCLNVSSVCGMTQRCELTEVSCTPPQAGFDYSADELSISFIDTSSNDAIAWLWDFGDGSGSTQSSPAHNYLSPGTYDVCLTVNNVCGSTTQCTTIEVICPPVIPQFDYNISGLTLSFVNLTNDFTLDWIWDFGDGNISTSVNPIYTYSQEGTYDVCLIAEGLCGRDTLCQEIILVLDNNKEQSLADTQLKFFPNPAKDIGYIQFTGSASASYRWSLINAQGQVVHNGQGDSKFVTTVSLSHLPSGLYWLKVDIEGAIISMKVVVEN